jgi:hypothetical protein
VTKGPRTAVLAQRERASNPCSWTSKCLRCRGKGCRQRRESAMRSLIFAVFSVAALLSASSNAFAQGAQPIPQLTPQPTPPLAPQPTPQLTPPTPQLNPKTTPQPTSPPIPSETPSTAASSQPTTPENYMRAWPEPGSYHPCPASVGLPNGRTVCLGLDDERRRPRTRYVARRVASWGWGCRCCW